MKLNIGCGMSTVDGYLNVDLRDTSKAELIYDLNNIPWPWDDESIEHIIAMDVVEHLNDIFAVMDEVWRVMKPDCEIIMRTNNVEYQQAFTDPSHKHFFTMESFDFWDMDTLFGRKYNYYTKNKFKIMEKRKVGQELLFTLKKIK